MEFTQRDAERLKLLSEWVHEEEERKEIGQTNTYQLFLDEVEKHLEKARRLLSIAEEFHAVMTEE